MDKEIAFSMVTENKQPSWKFWKNLKCYKYWRNTIDLVPISTTDSVILDIGCNNGVRFDMLFGLGYKIENMYGIELDGNKALMSMGKCKTVYNDDAISVLKKSDRMYDIIIMSHVLDHVKNPNILLSVAVSRLNNGGEMLIAVPISRGIEYAILGNSWRFYDNRHKHYSIFDPCLIIKSLKELGLDILKTAYQPAKQDYPIIRHCGMIGSLIADIIAWCGKSSRFVIHCKRII